MSVVRPTRKHRGAVLIVWVVPGVGPMRSPTPNCIAALQPRLPHDVTYFVERADELQVTLHIARQCGHTVEERRQERADFGLEHGERLATVSVGSSGVAQHALSQLTPPRWCSTNPLHVANYANADIGGTGLGGVWRC